MYVWIADHKTRIVSSVNSNNGDILENDDFICRYGLVFFVIASAPTVFVCGEAPLDPFISNISEFVLCGLDCVHTMPADFENDEKCDG